MLQGKLLLTVSPGAPASPRAPFSPFAPWAERRDTSWSDMEGDLLSDKKASRCLNVYQAMVFVNQFTEELMAQETAPSSLCSKKRNYKNKTLRLKKSYYHWSVQMLFLSTGCWNLKVFIWVKHLHTLRPTNYLISSWTLMVSLHCLQLWNINISHLEMVKTDSHAEIFVLITHNRVLSEEFLQDKVYSWNCPPFSRC